MVTPYAVSQPPRQRWPVTCHWPTNSCGQLIAQDNNYFSTSIFDFTLGMRPNLTGYTEPDTVWLIELNGEFSDQTAMNHSAIAHTGGKQWFLSPGIFWTHRNFAIKAGLQLPVIQQLSGNQQPDDYRVKGVFEWHL
jgi:hypothetical protein